MIQAFPFGLNYQNINDVCNVIIDALFSKATKFMSGFPQHSKVSETFMDIQQSHAIGGV